MLLVSYGGGGHPAAVTHKLYFTQMESAVSIVILADDSGWLKRLQGEVARTGFHLMGSRDLS